MKKMILFAGMSPEVGVLVLESKMMIVNACKMPFNGAPEYYFIVFNYVFAGMPSFVPGDYFTRLENDDTDSDEPLLHWMHLQCSVGTRH